MIRLDLDFKTLPSNDAVSGFSVNPVDQTKHPNGITLPSLSTRRPSSTLSTTVPVRTSIPDRLNLFMQFLYICSAETYCFCSEDCYQEFMLDPAKYVGERAVAGRADTHRPIV